MASALACDAAARGGRFRQARTPDEEAEPCCAPRTLRHYVAKRFLLAILGAFAVCAVLIFMIDMIELLRLSRRAPTCPCGTLLWMALLRLPAFTEILLAFAVMVGSIGALLSLNRKSELNVMRAGGMSVWQFLRPGLIVAAVLGVVAVTLFNPLAAAARSEAERLVAEAFGKEASLLATSGEGSWLRQDGADGQSVMSARAVADQGLSLAGVIVFQFDAQGHFVERIDAEQAQHSAMATGSCSGRSCHGPAEEPEPFEHLHGQHLPDAGAGRRRAGLGDRGVLLAAPGTDRTR